MYYITNQPPGITVTFSPNPAMAPNLNSSLIFTATGSALPEFNEPYAYYAVWTLSNGKTSQTANSNEGIELACSNNARACPELQILDLEQSARGVNVTSPNPVQTVAVGLEMKLAASWQPSTGTKGYTFSYNAADPLGLQALWTISGDTAKSYDITVSPPAPTLAPSDLAQPSVDYYYLNAVNSAGDTLEVGEPLVRNDGNEFSYPTASASYAVALPSMSPAQLTTTFNLVQVANEVPYTPSPGPRYFPPPGSTPTPAPPTPAPEWFLSLGWGTNASTAGATFSYAIRLPRAGTNGGFIDMKQLIGSCISSVPPGLFGGTNNGVCNEGAYNTEEDNCPVLGDPTIALSGSVARWSGYDSPAQLLSGPYSSIYGDWYFDDYVLYRPVAASGKQRGAIWVYIAHIPWHFSGTANAGTAPPWAGPAPVSQGHASAPTIFPVWPTWNGIFNSIEGPAQGCAAIAN